MSMRAGTRAGVLVAAASLAYVVGLVAAEQLGFATGLGQHLELSTGVPRTANYGADPALPELSQLDPAVAVLAAQEQPSPSPSSSSSPAAPTSRQAASTTRAAASPAPGPQGQAYGRGGIKRKGGPTPGP